MLDQLHLDALIIALKSFKPPIMAPVDGQEYCCTVSTYVDADQRDFKVYFCFCGDCDEWHIKFVHKVQPICLN